MKNTWKLLHAAMLCLGKTLITAKRRVLLCFILFSLMIMMEPVLPAQLLSEWKLPEVHLFLCQRYNHHRCPSCCCCWKKSWEENQRWRWNLTHSHVTQSYVACVQSKIHFVIPASFATATLLLANFKLFFPHWRQLQKSCKRDEESWRTILIAEVFFNADPPRYLLLCMQHTSRNVESRLSPGLWILVTYTG